MNSSQIMGAPTEPQPNTETAQKWRGFDLLVDGKKFGNINQINGQWAIYYERGGQINRQGTFATFTEARTALTDAALPAPPTHKDS